METTALAGRALTGDSLGFYLFFALLSLTAPVLVSWFELRSIIRKDENDRKTADFWSRIAAVSIVGVLIVGTIGVFQAVTVWPGLLDFSSKVMRLPFMLWVCALFVQTTLTVLYVRTWGKVAPILHWLIGLFVVISATLGVFAVSSLSTWLSYPTGFSYIDDMIVDVNVWSAMFSDAALISFVHIAPAYLLAGTLMFAAGYSVRLFRAKKHDLSVAKIAYTKTVVHRLMLFAAVLFVVCGITGDLSGTFAAAYSPTSTSALMVNNDVSKNTTALLEVLPKIKLLLLDALALVFVFYFGIYFFKRRWLYAKFMNGVVIFSALLAVAMVELGWMINALSRQPWAVRGFVTMKDALTKSPGAELIITLSTIGTVVVLVVMAAVVLHLVRTEKRRKNGAL